MKRFSPVIALFALMISVGALSAQTVVTPDTSTAVYTAQLSTINQGADSTGDVVDFALSGFTLVNQNFIEADTLNSVVTDSSGNLVRSMPGSDRLAFQAALQDDGGVFTDYTTEINDTTADDVPFLPATPVAGDAFYFGQRSPGRIITLNIGQPGEGDWSLVWEYFDGTTWDAVSDLVDNTASFTALGVNTVSFELPTDWANTTVNAIDRWWIRARVDSVTTSTTQPLGTQGFWESGSWFTHLPSIPENTQINDTLYIGGPTDFVTQHQIFPGEIGIVTPDDATIEPGQAYQIRIEGWLNVDATSAATEGYVFKDDAIEITNPSAGTIQADLNNGGATLTLTGLTEGYYTLSLVGTPTSTTLTAAGPVNETDATGPVTINNNANDWNWMSGNTVQYADSVSITFPVSADWPSSGQLAFDGTLTNIMEYLDISGATNIGQITSPGVFGATHLSASSEYCYTNLSDLVCTDDTDATVDNSNCALGTNGAQGLTHDGTNFWAAHTTDTDIHEWTVACVDTSNFDISAVSSATMGLAWNSDDSRLALFSNVAGNPTLSIYQTNGTQDSSNTITNMISSPASDENIVAATYLNGFYYVLAFDGSSNVTRSLWRMTDSSDAVRVFQIDDDRYGYMDQNSASQGVAYIQPANSPFETAGLANDGTNFYYYNNTTFNNSNQEESVIVIPTATGSVLQIANDWCTNLVSWTNGNCASTSTQRFGLAENQVLDGNYSFGMYRGTAGLQSTSQQTPDASFSPGTVYSFGVETLCGGETARLEIDWRDSSNVQIGATLVASASSCGGWTELSIENETAPALTDHITFRLEYQCVGICGGVDNNYFDCAQAVENTAIETPCATTSTNLIDNESFEELYQTAADSTNLWESESVNLTTITDVLTSSISWGETVPGDSSLLIETSIDGGSMWSTATNGSTIPGITTGQDLTGVSLLVRGTFEPTTDQTQSSELASMLISVSSQSGDGLEYVMNTLPTLIIPDNIGSNDGEMSFPLRNNQFLLTSTGPLTPVFTPSNQDQQALNPDVVDEITPPNQSTPFDGTSIPFNDFFVALQQLSGNNVPAIVFWMLTSLIIILGAGIITFFYTQSIAWPAAVMALVSLGFVNFGATTAGSGLMELSTWIMIAALLFSASVFAKVRGL